MENILEKYCVGFCPSCGTYGMLFVEKFKNELCITCDECLLEFQTPEDAQAGHECGHSVDDLLTGERFTEASIEDILAKGWEKYIYVWHGDVQKWVSYTDKTKYLD